MLDDIGGWWENNRANHRKEGGGGACVVIREGGEGRVRGEKGGGTGLSWFRAGHGK